MPEITVPDFEDPGQLRRLLRAQERATEKSRRQMALSKARMVARCLKENFGVEQVYLYGSLAGGIFSVHSDIDIFVVGFKDNRRYWPMQLQVEEIAAPFPVSVVCDDEASPSLKKKVLERGIQLA